MASLAHAIKTYQRILWGSADSTSDPHSLLTQACAIVAVTLASSKLSLVIQGLLQAGNAVVIIGHTQHVELANAASFFVAV